MPPRLQRCASQVRLAAPEVIEEAIRPGGLAAIKTGRIQAILETLHSERGECSLEHMRGLSDEDVKAELRGYKGVGAKTVSCVHTPRIHCTRAQAPHTRLQSGGACARQDPPRAVSGLISPRGWHSSPERRWWFRP